uniref:Peptidyl-prolyl cis-trans isomerase n=1 Tax=uncultured Thiotrichaceae bacterium TaxID=298394 RepID=A0A6S6UG57_9GAMM|nr:MAG: Peptidyl-prolyl cis-trans isomerase [uncultured Thiotrichaceae bacterium]
MHRTIQNNSQIRWRYRLLLANGELFEANENEQGDTLHLGQDEIHPNLESVLPGLSEGEEVRFLISAEEAFGARDSDAIQTLSLSGFPGNQTPQPDQIISFTLPSGQEVPGHIMAVSADSVTVDFNHPLAGHNIVLEVEILEILE